MPVNYIDPWEGRVPSLKDSTFSQTAPTEKQNSGIFGDLVDAFQQGAYQSAAGDAEAVGQISDSDTFKSIGKALAKGANSQTDTMTGDAKQALSQHIFKDDPDSFTGVAFDDGATNWRTWALQFGVLAGQVAGTMATGFGAGSVVKAGAKTAIKAFAKEAVTKEAQQLVAKNAVKEAIRNGALDDVRAALIAAPDKAAMNAVLNKATSRLGGIATTAVAGSMAAGMRAQQARDEYLGLDADTLNQNPEFQKAYWEIADNPENQGLDTSTIHNAAKEMLAEKAATTAFFDKKALLSDLASGAYVPGVGGILERGAATASKLGRFGVGLAQEGATEAWQGGETQRAVNEAIKEWGDESRDPMAGVLSTRFEEGVLGGVFGGAVKMAETPETHTKPIITVEKPALTGNSMLDGALAQSAADEQTRYGDLSGAIDEQQALIRSQRNDASAEAQLADAINGGNQGKTLYETTLNDEGIVPESRRLPNNGVINLGGTPGDGINSAYIPPIVSRPNAPQNEIAPTTAPLERATLPEGGAAAVGVMKATNSPVTGNPDIPAYLRQANISDELRATAQGDTTQTPGGNVQTQAEAGVLPPRNKVVTGNPDEPAYLRQLSTLRVTKRGKPFASQKEAQLASRQTETPIELPSGGFGVVNKTELDQVLSKWGSQPQANFEGGMPQNQTVPFDAPTKQAETTSPEVNPRSVATASMEDIEGGRIANVIFDPNLNSEAEAGTAKGKIKVGKKFFDLDPVGKEHVINHELSHYDAMKIGVGVAIDMTQAGFFGELKEDGTIANGPNGQFKPDEALTESLTIYKEDPKWLMDKYPKAYAVIDSYIKSGSISPEIMAEINSGAATYQNAQKEQSAKVEKTLSLLRDKYESATDENERKRIGEIYTDAVINQHITKEVEALLGKPVITDGQSTTGKTVATDSQSQPASNAEPISEAASKPELASEFFVDGERTAIEGWANKHPSNITRKADIDQWKKGYVSGKNKKESLLSGLEPVVVEDRKATPRISMLNDELKIEWREPRSGKVYDSAENARIGLEDYIKQSKEFGEFMDELEKTRKKPEPKEVKVDNKPIKQTEYANDGSEIINHTTAKGKPLRGVVRPDLTTDEAKAIDPFTFKGKYDGYFIREKYFDQLPPKPSNNENSQGINENSLANSKPTENTAEPAQAESGTAPEAEQQEVSPAKDQFADNKLFTSDMVAAARARLKSKLANLNSGLDPEIVIDGMTITGAYIESGLRTFSAYAKAMTEDFGDKVKPYLLSFWEGARHYPGLDTAGMTSAEESAKQHAALMRGEEAPSKAPAKPTSAVSKKTGKGDLKLKQDWGVEMIDGYGDSVDRETGNDLKDSYLKDATKYLQAVEGELARSGFVPHLDKKGKPQRPVTKNEGGPAVSGDVNLTMRHEATGVNLYVNIGSAGVGFANTTPSGISVMYRASNKPGDTYATAGQNRWGRPDLSAAELATILNKEAARVAPAENNTKAEPNNDSTGNSQQGVAEADRAGVSRSGEQRGASTQSDVAQRDLGNVEAEQSEDVSPTISGGDAGQAGVRATGADVSGDGRADGGGVSGNGRKGAGGEGASDAGTRGRRDPAVVKDTTEVSPANTGPGNFHITNPLDIVGGTPIARFNKNKAAIELYNQLREEGRRPTKEEQAILAGYTGWGSFGQELFQGTWQAKRPKAGWEERDSWLREQLGKEEWEGLQRSITNAHYTDPPTVTAMWDMVQRMGFTGGRVLEPSMGIGNFFGMMPEALKARSKLAGIELDLVTGGMAKMLYPDANINIMGYQESKTPDSFYDVVIGNWPFENTVIADRRYNRLNPFLHDYFFLKAVDQVRPGGLVIGITSKGTMDKQGTGIRTELAKKAELVAAFRLPSGAFEEYAGTNVVTDIIILRKRPEAIGIAANEGWIQSVPYMTPQGESVFLNEYYVSHPENVIGTIEYGHGTTFKRPGMIVTRPADMQAQLQRIISMVPEGAYKADTRGKQISYITNHTSDREGALVKSDKGFFVVQGEYLAPAGDVLKYEIKDAKKTQRREDQLSRLIDIRKAYGELISLERSENQADASKARKELNKLYTDFVANHGLLNDSFGLGYLKKINDPFYAAIASLEIKDGDGYRQADILTKSTIRGQSKIKNPSIADAYILSRNQSINPSLADIARQANKPEAEVKAALLDAGAVFELPNGDVMPSDMYLSGNVREKLRQALAAKEQGNAGMDRNITALRKVIPEDVPYFKIEVQLGASWVPTAMYEDYIAHMLGLSDTRGISVTYKAGRWRADISSSLNARSEAKTGFGSANYPFSKLVNAALSNQAVTIKIKLMDGSMVVDKESTEEVNNKISEIRKKFSEWLWSDPERRIKTETEYNEVRNVYASPSYDGSFMTFEGMALSLGKGPFNLREHQVNAIWRALVTRKSLNAHEVGTGKTFTMGGIAIESRRYGIAKKPMILAHNANSKSVAAEIQQMYPAAKVLYIDNLSRDQIETRMRQIANDDWDAIVLPHSLISSMAMKEETLMAMAQEEIDAIMEEAYQAAKEDGVTITEDMLSNEQELGKLRSPTAKDLVKTRNKIIESIKKQAQQSSKENAIPFEDLGIDMLLVDEAHEFKKPPISTRMRMKGLNTGTSDRSIALSFMARYIRGMNNGGNIHLFTGTPITNTLTEIYHQMRYIMNEEMADASVDQWDGWFGSFAKEVMDVELNGAGEYEAVTRLAGFINVPELRRMIGQYMDVVYADDMPEMKPRKTKSGKTMTDELSEKEKRELLNGRTEDAKDRPYKKVVNETSDLTDKQKAAFREIQAAANRFRNMSGKDRRDAMRRGALESPLIYEGMANKVSFDARLLHAEQLAGKEGQIADDPNSKASRVIKNVLDIYHSDPRATQVIFAQQGLSKTATRSVGPVGAKRDETYKVFSTIHDMIERLVQQGIPREEIALVDGSTSKDKRKQVADAMNAGTIRVVIGSSQSLGVGVNMQKNLRAMHHMDAPWMPGDLEQRNGRGHRQGNQWNTVLEYRYLTDRIDGRRWQVLAIKQKFITAFLRGGDGARIIEGDAAAEEESDILASFAEAAGDPRILIRTKLQKKLEQVRMRERLHGQGVADAKIQYRKLTAEANESQEFLDRLKSKDIDVKAAKVAADNAGKNFTITLRGKSFDERKAANEALVNYAAEMGGEAGARKIGSFGGHDLTLEWLPFETEPTMNLVIDGFGIKTKATIASLEATLRNVTATFTNLQKGIDDKRQSAARAKQVSEQSFHQASELDALSRQLDELEADLQANPVAPPAWLRAGSPLESEVYHNGKPVEVTGHRWNDKGWFVLAEEGGKTVEIPYLEVKDSQGMPLYEKHDFKAPEVVQKETKENKANLSKVPLNATEQAGKGMKPGETHLAAKEWLRQFKTDIQVKVARNQAEFNQMLEDMGQSAVNADEVANAAYIPESKTLLLNASAIQNPARLRQLMRHEILGHHGLEYVIGKGAVNDILQILKNGYDTSKAIRDAVDTVAANYADADAETKIKEAFAHYAENRPVDQGALGRLWDRVVSAVKSALVKAGFIKPNEAEQQLDLLLKTIAEQMRNGTTNNDPNGGPGKKTYFSKAVTDDETLMAKLGLGPKPNFADKTKSQLEQLRKADKSTVKAWLDQLKRKANTQILDALAPIKYAEEQAGKFDASDSGYVAARLASGSASVMQATMMYGIPQWKDGVIQRKAGTSEKDSLLGIFEGLGADLHNWLAWMAGHRAEILMREGRENLLTEDDIKALKAKSIGKEAKFKAAKEKWNTLNKAMLDLAQEAGLFTADDRAAFESEWYVPFFRETDDGDVMGPYKKNGIANQSSGIKKLKGGTANVNDILENIFQTTSKLIDSSMKNMAAQKVVYNLADTDLIEVVTKPNMLDIKAAVQNKQNLMIVKMEGENYLIRVNDPDLFRAMTMIDGTVERDPFRKAAMKAKHILTAGVTASPDFMLRNFLRDAASTWAINEDGFKPMIDSIRGVKKAWKMDDSSVDMMFSGASFMGGNLRGTDPEAMASVIRKTLRRKGMSPEQISKYENSLITNGRKAKDVLLSAWEKYEKAGEAVENGSREAVYEAAIKAGKSHAQAAFEAKDLMDFSMLGSSKIMRYMVDVLPFFNARMQGLGKLGRAVAANPKQIAKRGGMIAAASLALMALNWDDDRYNDLPDWDKDNNWHFFIGDEHWRIPKPFEIGLLFGTLPERMVRTMGGKDTVGKFGEVVARNFMSTIEVNPFPQLVRPLTESYFNYDMFRGAPIENMSDLNVAPEARYDERTSLLMREIGQITGLSPKKLEHIVTGYTGTIGAYVVGICDAIVRASGDYGAAPAIRADQIPLLKSIYQGSAPAKSSQAMTDFYQLLDEANQVYSTIRQYQKEGRMGDAQEMLEENRNKLAGRKTMTNAQKQFRQIRNEMELIQRDRNLNSDEKRERIDRLLSKRNNFAAKLIKRFGTEL